MHKTLSRQLTQLQLLCGCLAFSPNAIAVDGLREFGFVAQAASDWIYDGTTETRSRPGIGVNGEWRSHSAFFLGFEAHEASVAAEQQRERSAAIYMGLDYSFKENWYSALSIQHREFPGSVVEWDFTEVALKLAYRDNWSFEADYSPNYYERGTKAYGVTLTRTANISARHYWSVQTGTQQQSESRFVDYHYARLGIGMSTAATNLDLSYGWNSEDGNILFGNQPLLSPELVLQLNYRLR